MGGGENGKKREGRGVANKGGDDRKKIKSAQVGNLEGISKKVRGVEREKERRERWERKNNLTIVGLNAEEGKEKASVGELLVKDLKRRGKIKKVRRQGTKKKEVIIVEMESWDTKKGRFKGE